MPNRRAIVRRVAAWRLLDGTLLALLVTGVMSVNTWWIHTETRPPHWDMARHLWTSLVYQQIHQTHNWFLFMVQYDYYPPFVYWWVQPFYKLLGTNIPAAVFANILYVAILVVSVYAMGRKLGGRLVGLSSAVLVVSYPMFVTQFKEFQLDAPLAAMVAAGLCLLIYSEGFKRRGYTLAFGVVCGVGMLTKWTFVACLVLPTLITAGQAVVADIRARSPRRVTTLAVALLLGYTIASPWYLVNFQQFKIDMKANGAPQAILEGDPRVGSLASNFYYFFNLINQQIFLPGVLLALVGLAVALRKSARVHLNRLLLPLSLIGGTYLVFTFIANKDPRYTLPMLPAVAVVSCYWISTLRRQARLVAAILICLYGVVMFTVISFGSAVVPKNVAFRLGSQTVTVFAQRGYIIGPPTHEQWGLQRVFLYVQKQPADRRSVSYSGTQTIWLNSWDLQYYSLLDGVALAPAPQAGFQLKRTSGPAAAGSVWRQALPDGGQLALYRR
jgi:4-amino-4-deoxy-L-arabinose transferase-like glycosyltransferase